jgi:Family of unknown function (DUF6516)
MLEEYNQLMEEFGALIADKEIIKHTQTELKEELKVRIVFKDQSWISAFESFRDQKHKYQFQWMKEDNSLLISWGNDSHHPEISTQPHHKHVGNRQNVQPSEEMNLRKVLLFIGKTIVFILVLGYSILYFLAPKASVKAEKAKIEVKKIEKRSKK